MNQIEKETSMITREEAKKLIAEMNLINGFLFDSALEVEEDAKIVMGSILKSIFKREFNIKQVTSQKPFQAIDINYHGIRFDAYITEESASGNPEVTIYDVEMEDRKADKKYLPKRFRYYSALHDSKLIEAGHDYNTLPNFVSVTILSYDPFSAGDMYYEASTLLTTHPDISYDDGIMHIYLYCNGPPNFDTPGNPIHLSPEHSKKLQEMLKYIVSGQKPISTNTDIDAIDKIVAKVKGREEVTTAFMKQWDRELSIKRETKEDDALKMIRFARKHNISDDDIRSSLESDYDFPPSIINNLFSKINAEGKETVLNK